jgi:hypothetical protein
LLLSRGEKRAAPRGGEAGKDREPAAERREGEEDDPDQEQSPVAEEVAQPARQEEKAAEGKQVDVRDPGMRALREAEILSDRPRSSCDVEDSSPAPTYL